MITQNDLTLLAQTALLAGYNINANNLQLTVLQAGLATHVPTQLPQGFSAVYSFFYNGQCLKVGKVGPNSSARYLSQHYNSGSCNSNLSKSLLNSPIYLPQLLNLNPGVWVKTNTTRCNILIPINYDKKFVHFAEAFFILKYQPLF